VQFSCDSCKTQLQIADEKVRGKRLIVRCRRCGAKITISDPALPKKLVAPRTAQPAAPAAVPAPAAAPPPVAPAVAAAGAPAADDPKRDSDTESTVAMDSDLLERALQASKAENPEQVLGTSRPPGPDTAAPTDPAIWFAMLHGKQTGPLTRADLAGRAASGEVGPRTYLWKEGMDSWQRAREVPELVALFPQPLEPSIPAPPLPSLEAEKAPDPDAVDQSFTDKPEVSTNPELMPLGERVHQEAVANELFTGGEAAPPSNSSKELASWANSDLGKQTNPGVARARVAATSAVARPAQPDLPRPRPVSAPPMFESAAPPRSRAPLAILLAVALAGAAIAVWVFLGTEKKEGAAAPADAADASVPAAPQKAESVTPQIEPAAVPAAGLTPDQVRRKLDDNKSALQGCIDEALKRDPNLRVGKIHIATTIAPSGQVTATRIDKRSVDEGPLGVCLKRTTRKIAFPSFNGEAFDVDIPIAVTAGD
jgi:predicted Zn finger-like uncharacterized protein